MSKLRGAGEFGSDANFRSKLLAVNAIVLTCDRYRRLSEHMIACYARLWPTHPFKFRVAAQSIPSEPAPARVTYRECPLPIKATVLTLLEDLADEEWVYWCIDDKYPMWLDLRANEDAARWIEEGQAGTDVSGVLLCRCRALLRGRFLTGEQRRDTAGNLYLERLRYDQIWLHQYLRVKVLRALFSCIPTNLRAQK